MTFEKLKLYTHFKLFRESNIFIKCKEETITFDVLKGDSIVRAETLVNCLRDDGLLVYINPDAYVDLDYNMESMDEADCYEGW